MNRPAFPLDPPGYADRVRELEAQGLTRSDAQGCADAEERSRPPGLKAYRVTFKRSAHTNTTEARTRWALDFGAAAAIAHRELAEDFFGAAVLLSVVELVP